MTLTTVTGTVQFKVAGQAPDPKWKQAILRKAIEGGEVMPEALRFQCRIATDAQENLSVLDLHDGETLTLHYKKRPQFGRNQHGQAYLTATFTYSGDGQGYCLRWVGDAVPQKMKEVAVKHDKGLAVKPTVVLLDLGKASVTPSWRVNGHTGPSNVSRSGAREKALAEKRRANGKPKITRSPRVCGRLTEDDLGAA